MNELVVNLVPAFFKESIENETFDELVLLKLVKAFVMITVSSVWLAVQLKAPFVNPLIPVHFTVFVGIDNSLGKVSFKVMF